MIKYNEVDIKGDDFKVIQTKLSKEGVQLNCADFYYSLIPDAKNEFEFKRVKHVRGCIDLAIESGFNYKEVLAVALHDIGYFTEYVKTGWHPIDGYLYLKKNGYDIDLCLAILYHTNAYDLCPKELVSYYESANVPIDSIALYEAIVYCDSRVDGEGNIIGVENRYKDIFNRYGEDSMATRVFKANKDFYNRLSCKYGR